MIKHMHLLILVKQLLCIFLHNIFGFERHCFFPLVYFMLIHEDVFQDYLGGVKLNSECTLSIGNWISQPKTKSRVLHVTRLL